MFRRLGARQVCPQLLLLRASPALASSATTALLASSSQAARSGQPSAAADRASQVRTFASPRAPRPSPRAPRPPPRAPKLDTDGYNLDGITAESFDNIIKSVDFFKALPAAGYYEVAQRFVDAVRKGSHPWSVRLTGGENPVPAVVLYDVGCMIRHMGASKNLNTVSVDMWVSASEMGNRLATMTLARHLVRGGHWGTRNFAKVEDRFRQLVAEGKEPNALVVQGELLYRLGNYFEAVKTLKKALGPDNSKQFEWKTDCQVYLAKSYVKLQKPAEARAILEGISDSGSAEASDELAKLLLSENSDRAEQLLFTAALNGKLDSFRQLSEISLENQSKATSPEEKKEHNLWAMEFARLADPKAPF